MLGHEQQKVKASVNVCALDTQKNPAPPDDTLWQVALRGRHLRFRRRALPDRHRFTRRQVGPYDTFMLILCVWALGILALARFAHWSQATLDVLAYADDIVC